MKPVRNFKADGRPGVLRQQGVQKVALFGIIAGPFTLDDLSYRAIENVEVGLRVDGDPEEGPGDEGREDHDFAQREIRQL